MTTSKQAKWKYDKKYTGKNWRNKRFSLILHTDSSSTSGFANSTEMRLCCIKGFLKRESLLLVLLTAHNADSAFVCSQNYVESHRQEVGTFDRRYTLAKVCLLES